MSADEYLHRSCPACGSASHSCEVGTLPPAEELTLEELRPFWAGFHDRKLFFSYHRCSACGLLFAPVFFDDAQLAELYSNLAPNMDMVPSTAIEATQRGYFKAAEAVTELGGGYLEIGPDVGYVARLAAQAGHFEDFWLFEPNRAVHPQLAAAIEPNRGHLFTEMSDLSPVPDGSIGLAVMIQVLDHLLDPLAMLQQVHAKLRPGGSLLIVTHDEGSLLRKVLGKRWPPFCLQHPQVYNPASMTSLVRRAGYVDVKVSRSTNYFPIAFLAQQAALAAGLKLKRVPLPNFALGLKLGNIITIARR